MKNLLNYIFLATILFSFTFVSCQKDEKVVANKKAKVVFKPAVDNAVKADVLRPNDIPFYVNTMNIKAKSMATGDSFLSADFTFKDSGAVEANEISMDVFLGSNTFTATTTAYPEGHPNAPDPQSSENDGVSTGGSHNEAPFDGTEDSYDEFRDALRSIPPYATFTGVAENVMITDGGDNVVNLNMQTNHGRFIATFEFDDSEGMPYLDQYKAKFTVNVNSAGAPGREFGIDKTYPIGWLYWSNDDCQDGEVVKVVLKLYNKDDNISTTPPLKTTTLHLDNPEVFKVNKGKDKYVRVVIGKDYVTTEVAQFEFYFDWTENNDNVEL